MNTAARLKAKFTCKGVLASKGYTIIDKGKEYKCLCPFHQDRTPSLDISKDRDLWVCRAGCGGGDVINLLARFENKTAAEYLKSHKEDDEPLPGKPPIRKENPFEQDLPPMPEPKPLEPQKPDAKAKIVATYDYQDANGKLVYQSVRFEPGRNGGKKDFSQRRVLENGTFAWDMNGIERVLYRLPMVRKTQEVWIVEGEKDVATLEACGLVATCNVGGAGKWLESYGEHLKGKDLVLCGDNDTPGREHIAKILEMVEKIAKTVRHVKVPEPSKDITDHLEGMSDTEAAEEVLRLRNLVEPLYQGETLPLKTMEELEVIYKATLREDPLASLYMGRWLPSLAEMIMEPGDIVAIIAETGIGKTALLTNIALSNDHLQIIAFQMELSAKKMFERHVQTALKFSRKEVRKAYAEGGGVEWKKVNALHKILTCTESGLTLKRLESLIRRSELKIGRRPNVVFLDYIQLMKGEGSSRYERFTDIAEGLKLLAKQLGVIIVIASQVHRNKEREYGELSINDAKDSGAIENSCGLMLGASRSPTNKNEMCVQVLKATDYGSGLKITCNYDYETLKITEQYKPPEK